MPLLGRLSELFVTGVILGFDIQLDHNLSGVSPPADSSLVVTLWFPLEAAEDGTPRLKHESYGACLGRHKVAGGLLAELEEKMAECLEDIERKHGPGRAS